MVFLRGCVLTVVLFAAGCSSIDIISEDHVAADENIYNAVASEYLAYVEADTKLDDEKKNRRKTTVLTWKIHVDQAKAKIADEKRQEGGEVAPVGSTTGTN